MHLLLKALTEGLIFDDLQQYGSLAILPLKADASAGPEYLSLSEAMAARSLTITEVSEGGSVPELAVVNLGGLPVLLLDGEEIIGAKQNRVVNTTILLKENSKTVIPVSCVERGRWNYASREFRDSENLMTSRHRVRKCRAVTQNMEFMGRRASDQGEVWEGISELAAEFNVSSSTDAMRDVYRHVEGDLTKLLRSFHPVPDQRGMAVFIGNQLVGVDYISQPRVFAKVFEKLLRSYAMDALREGQPVNENAGPEVVRGFLSSVAEGKISDYEAIGYGREHRFKDGKAVGSALTLDDDVIHLSLLAAKHGEKKHWGEGGFGEEEPEVPFPRSYWVRPGNILAGCYPGAPTSREADRKLCSLLDADVRCVINLMEAEELDHQGRPFVQYDQRLIELANERGIEVTCLRIPIPDHCVPTREAMRAILDTIDQQLDRNIPVYLHSWGGKGRTGTVVGCWLARHGVVLGENALRHVQYLRRNDPTVGHPSPENRIQRQMVSSWHQGE